MKKNLLIDTCVLRELISKTEFSGYLSQIKSWYDGRLINILAPPSLVKEWEKHREIELSEVKKIIKKKASDIKTAGLFGTPVETTDDQLSRAEKILLSQADVINELIDSSANIDEKSVAGFMWEHSQYGKAPFHNKKDSSKDAVIIFSAIEEVRKLNENEIIVISKNHTDFADRNDKTKIHPDIANLFPEVNVIYYNSLSESIKDIIEMGLPSLLESKKRIRTVDNFFPVNQNLSLLDQLYSYLDRRFSDINFLSKHLYYRHSPILLQGNNGFQDSPFFLNTDNKELFSLFASLEEKEDIKATFSGDQEYQTFKKICKFLYHNLTYGIKLNTGERARISNIDDSQCDCEMCRYRKFRFADAIELMRGNIDKEITLQTAYAQYLLADISGAIATLKEVTILSTEEKKPLTNYIAHYNLFLIKRHLIYGNKELSNSIDVESLDIIYNLNKAPSNTEILSYLANGNFLKLQTEKLTKLLLKIKGDQVDKANGWSNHLPEFLECYFEIVFTIELNYIMLDGFSELSGLTSLFIDGLFASYSCNEELTGKFLELNDLIIQKIILYGRNEDLIKFKQRYNIKIIKYSPGSGEETFINQFSALFNSFNDIVNKELINGADGAFLFWPKIRRMLLNCITLSGIITLKPEEVQYISGRLLDFLRFQKHLHVFELTKAIGHFIYNYGDQFPPNILLDYIKFSYLSEDDDFNLSYSIKNFNAFEGKLIFTPNEWERITLKYMPDQVDGKRKLNYERVCSLYRLLNNKVLKAEINYWITEALDSKFDSDLYYNATMSQIYQVNEQMTLQYEQEIFVRAEKRKQPKLISMSYYNDVKIDEFLNFCFCYNRSVPDRLNESLKLLDLYYQWLLTMDSFDYTNFNGAWLFVHDTKFYYERFKNCYPLRDWMRKEALESSEIRISKLFIQLFSEGEGIF